MTLDVLTAPELHSLPLDEQTTWEERLELAKAKKVCAWCGAPVGEGRRAFCSKDHSRRYHSKRMQRINREKARREREIKTTIDSCVAELMESRYHRWGDKLRGWTLVWQFDSWDGRQWHDDLRG